MCARIMVRVRVSFMKCAIVRVRVMVIGLGL